MPKTTRSPEISTVKQLKIGISKVVDIISNSDKSSPC